MLITIEDPVEYELPGAYQLQTNAVAGVTFATAPSPYGAPVTQ